MIAGTYLLECDILLECAGARAVDVHTSTSHLRGDAFFDTNADLLERYAACETAAEVVEVQNTWLQSMEQQRDGE